ncbi:asparagine synthase [Gloeocapsopsis crepidinum LEGE 06123]|uniref:asparagine synthase (glutamine-hydrolyzing) n=1 Tax=Gloeocapsopsis crepidinum LEGE 06123 TaxID=588587 RepID=A0ABR9UM55_9CHRO|nr:asparagine synthase-related protein [Gloeocapsopsis crepidinum]MBE9189110.1 asparagine synthase [Gloeocapsopsis crepidinum LEGE 06123]
MRVGFDVFASEDGEIEFHVFSPHRDDAARPALVTFARDYHSGNAAVLLGHLCYQDELLARLPQSAVQKCTSDAAIALAAYCHLGDKGLEQLEGEFSLVVWDSSQQKLFALRDSLGCWPLYWLVQGTQMAISNSVRSLLNLLPNTAFDREFIAQFLMCPSPAVELPTQRTPFDVIKRVLPGTMLTITSTGQVEKYRWWDWNSKAGSNRNNNSILLEEAGEQYAQLFKQAVKERLHRGQIAAHLSGGMDSSSVVCIARDWMSSGVGQPNLHTLTAVYKRHSLAGEQAYAEMVINQGGPTVAHLIEADNAVDFQWFSEEIPYHDEPYAGLFRLSMEKLLVETAAQSGADTILTGLGSDELLAGNWLCIADLLRQGQYSLALSQANRLAQVSNLNVWSILYRCGIQPNFPILTREGIQPFLHHGFGRWPNLGTFSIPPWVLPEFARNYKMQQLGINNARRVSSNSTTLSTDLCAIQSSVGDWSGWYLAAPHGMHNSHPFRDSRLLSFCLSLPTTLRQVPGMPKPVLQTAMRGILPEAIRTRRDKKSFNDVYWIGLSKHLPQLEAMVRNSSISDLGVFDKTQLIQVMRQAAVGIGDVSASWRINTTLALIAWFDQITAVRQQPLEPTKVYRLPRQVALTY